jgi:hypothetical protein
MAPPSLPPAPRVRDSPQRHPSCSPSLSSCPRLRLCLSTLPPSASLTASCTPPTSPRPKRAHVASLRRSARRSTRRYRGLPGSGRRLSLGLCHAGAKGRQGRCAPCSRTLTRHRGEGAGCGCGQAGCHPGPRGGRPGAGPTAEPEGGKPPPPGTLGSLRRYPRALIPKNKYLVWIPGMIPGMGRNRRPLCPRCQTREKGKGQSYCLECKREAAVGGMVRASTLPPRSAEARERLDKVAEEDRKRGSPRERAEKRRRRVGASVDGTGERDGDRVARVPRSDAKEYGQDQTLWARQQRGSAQAGEIQSILCSRHKRLNCHEAACQPDW